MAQAEERLLGGWSNEPVHCQTRTEGKIVRDNLLTFFNFIFVALAAALFFVGSYKDAAFLMVALANTAIGVIQEIRSKRAVDKLKLLAAPQGKVVREGVIRALPTDQMVRDDIAVFSAGDQITADAVVRAGEVQVNEAMITGEADPLVKRPGDLLRSGSFVTAGTCRARLSHVGIDSYAARLTLEAKKEGRRSRSEMMASLDRLIRVIGVLLVPVGAILFWKQYSVLELGLRQSVTTTVAALIGMIPEGLYLLTSVALAVSMIRLARKRTLAQDMNCIETLARVDVLCVDKTGTITEQNMAVQEVVLLNERAYPMRFVEDAAGALYATLGMDNETGRALCERFPGNPGWQAATTVPFTSANKYAAAVFPKKGTFLMGAPEFVLRECYPKLKDTVESYSAKGYRVLLLAEYKGELKRPPEKSLEGGRVCPMALALLANRIRPEAPTTFAYFAQQGVAIKVISGDNPLTVSEVARKAGVERADESVDASQWQDDAALYKAAEQYTVFGRVTPGQKRKLIQALKEQGHTVAMTGDGVNDVLALKDADCGIAMASGSEAASYAAQLVLLDSNFSCLPDVVAEGRRVIHNIQRSASLFLVKNIFSFFLSLLTILIHMPYPLAPVQLSLISTLTIGLPSFVLALEPSAARVEGKFMASVLRAALPGGLTNLLLVLGVEGFVARFPRSAGALSTLTVLCMALVGLLVLYRACQPFNVRRRCLWSGVAAALAVSVICLGDFFSLSPLSDQEKLALGLFWLSGWPIMRALTALFDRLAF